MTKLLGLLAAPKRLWQQRQEIEEGVDKLVMLPVGTLEKCACLLRTRTYTRSGSGSTVTVFFMTLPAAAATGGR